MTYDALVADVHFLIQLGANFVRGAHYAQDQRFLDLCDVYGLLVWEDSWCSFGVLWSKCPEASELEPVDHTAITTVGNTLAKEVLGWQNTVADFANPTFVMQSLRSLPLGSLGRCTRMQPCQNYSTVQPRFNGWYLSLL